VTFSLVAIDRHTGQVGAAAMTAMLGVGKFVVHARAGVGAAASQAYMNPYLAMDGLDLMADGVPADDALARLIDADPGAIGRQFGMVDLQGRSASHTGDAPEDWKGHRTGDGYACQGNRLAGPEVLEAAVDAFLAADGRPLVERFLAALRAGEEAGGDTKGHHSATVLVMDTEAYPLWDLRIDDADDPLTEVEELHRRFEDRLLWQIEKMPTREDPMGGFDLESDDDGAV
jgi:uncharacterized Ntn-hydrolase superfamily protein